MTRATSAVGHLLTMHQARFHCSKQSTGEVVGVNAMATGPASLHESAGSGHGHCVGGAVINRALAYLNEAGKTISDEDLVMQPLLQAATGKGTLSEHWTNYRKAMLDYAGLFSSLATSATLSAEGLSRSTECRRSSICVSSAAPTLFRSVPRASWRASYGKR